MLLADMGPQLLDQGRDRGAIGGVSSGSEADGPRRNRFGERELGATDGGDDLVDDGDAHPGGDISRDGGDVGYLGHPLSPESAFGKGVFTPDATAISRRRIDPRLGFEPGE